EAGALDAVRCALSHRRTVAGCFRMRVRAEGLLYRSIDACATARVRLTGIVYGDQGLFVRRATFREVGGFPVVRLMEDVLLTARLFLALARLGRGGCPGGNLDDRRQLHDRTQGSLPCHFEELLLAADARLAVCGLHSPIAAVGQQFPRLDVVR